MKKPISLWIILIAFIFFTLQQLISSLPNISILIGAFIRSSVDFDFVASLSIVWSMIQTSSLVSLYVITLFVIFMKKEIAPIMLKIFWCISMLPMAIVIAIGIQNAFDNTNGSHQAESSGEILGSLFLAGLLVYLTYSLFFSSRIKDYFQYLQNKQSTQCIDKN